MPTDSRQCDTAVRCRAACEGLSASRSRVLRASVRIFLEADERGQFRRRVGSPPSTPAWFAPILTLYLQFVRTHRGLAPKTARKYIQKLSAFAQYLEGAGVTRTQTRLRRGTFVSFMRMQKMAGRGARTVPPFASSFAGPPRKVGCPVLWRCGPATATVSVCQPSRCAERSRGGSHPGRGGPIDALGRRDYAILLLAARYGLRPCDIRQSDARRDRLAWRAH